MEFKKLALAAAIIAGLSTQAQAGSELSTLLMLLHENGTITTEQYKRVLAEANATEQKNVAEKQELQAALDEATNVKVSVGKGGLAVKTRDGSFTTKIGGRMQLDSGWYGEDRSGSGSTLGDGTELRRARLYMKGTIYNDWFYKFEYDFANNSSSGTTAKGITDIWLGYNGFDFEGLSVKVGHFRDPFMLQDAVSDNNTQFTERASIDAFTAGRHIGAMASIDRKHWTAALGVFGESASKSGGSDDEGWGTAGRVTWMPINEKGSLIHLGLAADYRSTRSNDVRFKQQPETHVTGVNFVDTGTLTDVDNYLTLGAELAVVQGRFSGQTEYVRVKLDRDTASDPTFDGWYAQAGWFLTNDTRPYSFKGAKFKGVKPKSIVGKGGIGAWEVALRYSTIDLNDGGIVGGEMDNLTLGLNWYPTAGLRVSANYIKMLEMDREGSELDNEEADIMQLRGQWAF
ncbi:MAG: porin [Cycloclasticus sp. symbiont of Bathymodiolus heckerae]|nr:MAG: porin [Cycloclasticus sp. symbiont of Bathymodiolus heckerae]